MKRKKFIELATLSGGTLAAASFSGFPDYLNFTGNYKNSLNKGYELKADVIIAGGGLGGCAAALGALRNGLAVILTEETDWIGGQLTSQGVPPDEHQWIESHGSTRLFRNLRTAIREYYCRNYPLTNAARENKILNPGDGSVSRLCHEPRVALAVLSDMMAPYISSGRLTLLTDTKIESADVSGDEIRSLKAVSKLHGRTIILSAPYFIDATELGDLLPLTGTEYVTGTESKKDTGELHAPEIADPSNNQAFTVCFAMDHIAGENHVIDKPRDYDFWKNFTPKLTPPWSGRLLDLSHTDPINLKPVVNSLIPEGTEDPSLFNLWSYRRIINRLNFLPGTYRGDITIVNWPQNDYLTGNIIDATPSEYERHLEGARQLSLSLLYWLQTEVPRPDKGYGWPGIRPRGDIMGTSDGLAKSPYIRESRRIKAKFTVLEEHVGLANRSQVTGKKEDVKAAEFPDSVGVGFYRIDLHPSFAGTNYIDIDSLPFQIPLGALIPVRMKNLIAANKNIGTTHITNGCYRLHPVEWNIGESAGSLAAFAIDKKVTPEAVRQKKDLLNEFQRLIRSQGIETQWPA
ncbi:MAG: FAD-dependent oxidoreductase [Bacteroidales bacterium]|nr:FAD-dependent oxidoreductase [Bacteroidales bacterium]